jgi:hypothetical protein
MLICSDIINSLMSTKTVMSSHLLTVRLRIVVMKYRTGKSRPLLIMQHGNRRMSDTITDFLDTTHRPEFYLKTIFQRLENNCINVLSSQTFRFFIGLSVCCVYVSNCFTGLAWNLNNIPYWLKCSKSKPIWLILWGNSHNAKFHRNKLLLTPCTRM